MAGFLVGVSTVGGADPIGTADAPPSFAPDDDSGWGFTAAARIIATAALALSAGAAIAQTAQHQDEISQQVASGQGATSATNRRAQQSTGFQHWYQADDIAPQAAQPVDDAQGWSPAVARPPIVAHAWSVDDDLPVTPPTFAADDDWQPPRIASFTVAPMVFQANDDAPQTPATFAGDESTWQPVTATSVLWAKVFTADDEIAPSTVVGGAGSGIPGRRAVDGTRFHRWFATDDLPVTAATAVDDDPGWIARAKQSDLFSFTWIEGDASVPAQAENEHAWPPAASIVAPVVRLWLDQDEIAQTAASQAEDDYWLRPSVQSVAPTLKTWSGEDERPTPATFAPSEDDAPVLWRVSDAITAVVWATDDDIVPQPQAEAGFGSILRESVNLFRWYQGDDVVTQPNPQIDEDYHWRAFSIPPTVSKTPWVDDEWPTPAAPADVDSWQATPLQTSVTSVVWAISDEDIVPQPQLEDEYWEPLATNLVRPLATLWTQPDDIIVPAVPLQVDDEYWLAPKAYPGPITATLFQDDDLQGDFFAPPVVEPPTGSYYGYPRKWKRQRAYWERQQEERQLTFEFIPPSQRVLPPSPRRPDPAPPKQVPVLRPPEALPPTVDSRDARIAELEAMVADLTARLSQARLPIKLRRSKPLITLRRATK